MIDLGIGSRDEHIYKCNYRLPEEMVCGRSFTAPGFCRSY